MKLEEMTAQITEASFGESFEQEALKAFAVMMRTELFRDQLYPDNDSYTQIGQDITRENTAAKISDKVAEAVLLTKGKIITFGGKPIKPYFHYRCGGATENAENVIGRRITYLRKVLCTYCKEIKDENNEKYYTVSELEALLHTSITKQENQYIGIKGLFEEIEVDDQHRVKSIKIGTKIFKGTELMEMLKLNSTRFDYTPVKFLFKSVGIGSGLGLCQCGANEMARQGRTFDDILQYYYTGIEIKDVEWPEPDKPLKNKRLVLDAANAAENGEDFNMHIMLELKKLLDIDGAEVYLARDSRNDITLGDRSKLANNVRPDFFLSLQQNDYPSSSASGTEIYHYRNDTQGEKLAALILEELSTSLNIKNRGARTAEFYLLREVRVSSLLIQLLYLSNPDDVALLTNADFRKQVAAALHRAIRAYYSAM